jgi:hypothetical protein
MRLAGNKVPVSCHGADEQGIFAEAFHVIGLSLALFTDSVMLL